MDGVAGITLYFTGPGLGGTVSRLMNQDGSTWYSSIDTGNDKIVGSGTITFYAIAVDMKGAQTTSDAQAIRVIRCDAAAIYSIPAGVPPISPTLIPLNAATGAAYPVVSVMVGVTDADGTPSVRMTWQLTDRAGTTVLLSGGVTMTARRSLYSGSIQTSSSWWDAIGGKGGIGRLLVTFVSTDPYGGTTPYANTRVYNAYVSGL